MKQWYCLLNKNKCLCRSSEMFPAFFFVIAVWPLFHIWMKHGWLVQQAEKYFEPGAVKYQSCLTLFPRHPLFISYQLKLQRPDHDIKKKKEKATHFNQYKRLLPMVSFEHGHSEAIIKLLWILCSSLKQRIVIHFSTLKFAYLN